MSLMWLVLYPEIFQLKIKIAQCVMSLLAFDLCQTGFWHAYLTSHQTCDG